MTEQKETPQPWSNFDLDYIFGKPIAEIDKVIAEKDDHISVFQIPKHDGTKRTIIAPSPELKWILRRMAWKIFNKYKPSKSAHGFVRHHGIVSNAQQHVGARSLGKIDVEKFFDTIDTEHLKNCVFGNKNICKMCKNYDRMIEGGCHPSLYINKMQKFPFRCDEIKAVFIPNFCEKTGYQSIFTRIIELCTNKNTTPQGFPTSPVLANIVMRGFDERMIKHCEEQGITYTRYADDLTFSSKDMNKKELKFSVMKKAYAYLRAFRFKPKFRKTRFNMSPGRLQTCGIVVNVKLSMPRTEVKHLRAEIHHAIVKNAKETTKKWIKHLKGVVSYLMSIDRKKGQKYWDMLKEFEESKK
jgi:RNA-directed DNA polymerase